MSGVLELRRVGKRYGRRIAVESASVVMDAGEILGLVGPNGAGKTTVLRMAAGLVRPSSGEIVAAFAMHPGTVGYFGGERTLPPDIRVRQWRSLWNLGGGEACATRLEPSARLGTLSRGTRQQLGLECALASGSLRLLLLDEPWEGLDPDASRWLSDALRRKREAGVAIVVSSHRIHDLAVVSDRCRFMVGGRILPGSLAADVALSCGERASRIFDALDQARRAG